MENPIRCTEVQQKQVLAERKPMFQLTQTFTNSTGLTITPIEMEGIGFVFLPKELEEQLGYDELSKTIQ